MTLRTSLETSKKLKEAGIEIDGYEKAWSGYSSPPQLIFHASGWDKDIPAYSLDELLSHPKARERGIYLGWMDYGDENILQVVFDDGTTEYPSDLQSAIDFVAELLIEKN